MLPATNDNSGPNTLNVFSVRRDIDIVAFYVIFRPQAAELIT